MTISIKQRRSAGTGSSRKATWKGSARDIRCKWGSKSSSWRWLTPAAVRLADGRREDPARRPERDAALGLAHQTSDVR